VQIVDDAGANVDEKFRGYNLYIGANSKGRNFKIFEKAKKHAINYMKKHPEFEQEMHRNRRR